MELHCYFVLYLSRITNHSCQGCYCVFVYIKFVIDVISLMTYSDLFLSYILAAVSCCSSDCLSIEASLLKQNK